jgi:cobalamin biosynthesis protein CobT
MVHELEEYRPWTSTAQFEREIGKYVDKTEVARLRTYLALPK